MVAHEPSESDFESSILTFLESWEGRYPPTVYAVKRSVLGEHNGYDRSYVRFHLALFTLMEDGIIEYNDGLTLSSLYEA